MAPYHDPDVDRWIMDMDDVYDFRIYAFGISEGFGIFVYKKGTYIQTSYNFHYPKERIIDVRNIIENEIKEKIHSSQEGS